MIVFDFKRTQIVDNDSNIGWKTTGMMRISD